MKALNPRVVETDGARVLVERDATDADHIDGHVHRVESFDPGSNRLAEWYGVEELHGRGVL